MMRLRIDKTNRKGLPPDEDRLPKLPFVIATLAALIGAQVAQVRKDVPSIAKNAKGAVISVVMSDKDGRPIAQGSGFIISKDGRIVTNYHVVKRGTSAVVKLSDGAFFIVDGILAFDKHRDLAVIKAHGEDFHAVALGDSDRVQVGDEVVAIGSPLSLESTVSNGIVSAIRTINDEGGKFLQTTVPISPGSSGGPLFNMAGEVVGITSSSIRGGENLNFAIPINDVKPLLLPKISKVLNLPDEGEPETEHTPIEKQQANLSEQVSVLRGNFAAWWNVIYPDGAPFTIRDNSRSREAAWAPKFEAPKDVAYLNDGLGCVVFLKQGVPDICAPPDVRAKLAMEALREDWENSIDVPTGKNQIFDAIRNAIPMLWSEEKTIYCVLQPEAQYIDLSDSLKACVPKK